MTEAYIYCADIYCESCGEAIRKRLIDGGMIVDSDDFPKGPFPDGGGEGKSMSNEIKKPPDNLIDLWAALTPQLMETDVALSRLKDMIDNAE